MDYDVNHLCKIFHVSLVTSSCDPPERMSLVLSPCALLQNCSADLLGPPPMGKSITVVVDYFSIFVEGAILKCTIKAKIIEAISPVFARFGVLFSLRTDKGRQLKSVSPQLMSVSPHCCTEDMTVKSFSEWKWPSTALMLWVLVKEKQQGNLRS